MEKMKDDLEAVRKLVETLEPFSNEERERIVRWAIEKLGMQTVSTSIVPPITTPQRGLTQSTITQVGVATTDLKTFVAEKQPKSDVHFAATVAYFYTYEAPPEKRKESINKEDLAEAVRYVKWRQGLRNPGQTLINAYTSGILDKTAERGEYKLNMVGTNLVAVILPSGGTALQASKASRRAMRKTIATRKRKPKTTRKSRGR